jgi:hypothetical protein
VMVLRGKCRLSPQKTTQKKIKHPLPCTRLPHRKTGVVKVGDDNGPRKKLHRLGKVVHKETEMIVFFILTPITRLLFVWPTNQRYPKPGGWEIHFSEWNEFLSYLPTELLDFISTQLAATYYVLPTYLQNL